MKLLGGRYETLKPIASGGMAVVHLGRAVGVGGFERLVAIKVMHPHIASDPEFVAMFLDEARLAARIHHPNVVATIDVQMEGAELFLVMEFVDGPSLVNFRKAVAVNGEMIPIGIILRIMLDALAGLHEAHELTDDEGEPLNLIHRDATPANILVGMDGVARITDFGVARAEARLSSTRGGQLKGKIPYMPPEQLLGDPMDRRCDVYAIGVVLWEGLVGRRLFRADSDGRLVQMIISGPPHTPRQVNSLIPEWLDRVCMQALATSPDGRFATAAQFAEALELAAERGGVSIATPRAVAAFIESSGAHKKLSPKELAALKRGIAPDSSGAFPSGIPSSPSSPGSAPSGSHPQVAASPAASAPPAAAALAGGSDDAERSSTRRSPGVAQPEALPPASEHSSVTATEATISAQVDLPLTRPRRTPLIIGATAVVAAVGIVGGLVYSSGPESAVPASGDETEAVAPAVDPTEPEQPTAEPTAEPSATAADTATEAAEAPTADTASTAETTAPPQPVAPKPRPPPGTWTKPKPGPAKPRPGSTSYNPDRL